LLRLQLKEIEIPEPDEKPPAIFARTKKKIDISIDSFDIYKLLGRGGFGKVMLV